MAKGSQQQYFKSTTFSGHPLMERCNAHVTSLRRELDPGSGNAISGEGLTFVETTAVMWVHWPMGQQLAIIAINQACSCAMSVLVAFNLEGAQALVS